MADSGLRRGVTDDCDGECKLVLLVPIVENRRILEPLLEFPVDAEACLVDGLNDCSRAHQAPF